MTHPDKQAALELANRIGTDVTAGLSYEEILSRNPRAVYELAKAVIVQAAELERVRTALAKEAHNQYFEYCERNHLAPNEAGAIKWKEFNFPELSALKKAK